MYYVSNSYVNKIIDKTIAKYKKPLSRRKAVKHRLEQYEYARKNYDSSGRGQPQRFEGSKELNFQRASWDYIKNLLTNIAVFGGLFLVIAIPTTVFVWHSHQRSVLEASLWSAVQANNKPTSVVSPSTVGVTMPCKPTKTIDNNSDFTGASYSCNYIDTSYSTNSLSDAELKLGADGSSNDLMLALDPSKVIGYGFEVDTMRAGVSDTPYLLDCVSSSQDINNASDIPGEVMNVIENQTEPLQTLLGPNLIWNVCELAGTEGTIDLNAETVQNNTIIELNALTDSSYDNGLFNKFVKYLVSVN